MNLVVVFSTFPDLAAAREAARKLVEAKLAACVNLVPAVESVYRWEGKIESSAEVLAIIKTTSSSYDALERALKELHPYQVPEIVALDAVRVHPAYAAWIAESCEAP